MIQIVSVIGSIVILTAYIAAQRGMLPPHRRSYAVLNFVGSAVLAVVERQWGFLVLEGAWALVSAYSSIKPPRPPALAAQHQ